MTSCYLWTGWSSWNINPVQSIHLYAVVMLATACMCLHLVKLSLLKAALLAVSSAPMGVQTAVTGLLWCWGKLRSMTTLRHVLKHILISKFIYEGLLTLCCPPGEAFTFLFCLCSADFPCVLQRLKDWELYRRFNSNPVWGRRVIRKTTCSQYNNESIFWKVYLDGSWVKIQSAHKQTNSPVTVEMMVCTTLQCWLTWNTVSQLPVRIIHQTRNALKTNFFMSLIAH